MKLSAPLFQLKRQARRLARDARIPLHEALDRIARHEGFKAWSLLARQASAETEGQMLLDRLGDGDLLLMAGRPGNGKTLLGLEVLVAAMRRGHRGIFFTLEYSLREMTEAFAAIGEDPDDYGERFTLDNDDGINADHIMRRLAAAAPGTVVVIDYLQLLDQKREHPPLMAQVRALRDFARTRGVIIVCLSQIHWRYDPAASPCPGLDDVRLPNPLDLALFDKACFLNAGTVRVATVG